MAIIRARNNKNYTVINNVGLRDDRLSWKARGLLSYMLSLPDDWIFRDLELTNHAPDGKESTKKGLKELEQYGYLVKQQSRGERGKFATNDWLLYEVPLTDLPLTENPPTVNPLTDKPAAENPPLLSTDLPSTDLPSTDLPSTDLPSTEGTNKDNVEQKPDLIPYGEIIEYLNQKSEKHFHDTAGSHKKAIKARWNEGYRLDQFKQVIDNKCQDWLNDEKMNQYLQPSTLFGQKFDQYLNQKSKIKNQDPEKSEEAKRIEELSRQRLANIPVPDDSEFPF